MGCGNTKTSQGPKGLSWKGPKVLYHLGPGRGGLSIENEPQEALALVERAYRIDPASGERASFDLRHALFESGQDVSDLAVLERIASQLGVPMPDDDDRAAVLADWDDGQSRGVVGSPHYFCGDADAFCPSLDISREAGGGLSITRDTARMADFLARCLALTPTPRADGSGTESGHG